MASATINGISLYYELSGKGEPLVLINGLFANISLWANIVPSLANKFQLFTHMMDIVRDFAFHIYPTRKNANFIIQIDFLHHYEVVEGEAIKTRAEPDFRYLGLETITY